MYRKIICIDEEKCNGCGACAAACHEGAIAIINGKARLIRADYCDGLGDCLPVCPTGAIRFEIREAAASGAAAAARPDSAPCGCPGSQAGMLRRPVETASETGAAEPSQLRQWPVQIRLVPVNAPYFNGAHLLVAADCAAYACGSFHRSFIRGRITLIGCPKLDPVDYTDKLTQILQSNDIRSLTVARMEVPCCGGLEKAAQHALQASGKNIPLQTAVIAADGRILK